MTELSPEELKSKIENGETFLVDLFATWCGPCKIMLSNLEMVTKSPNYNTAVQVYKYNVESDISLSKTLGVKSVPTIKIFSDGKEVFNHVGVMSPDQITKTLDNY
jgi:thioredoxin 1